MTLSTCIRTISAAVALSIVMLSPNDADAQLTVQQPIFQSIGVQTSVVVPDRGGVILGGISRTGISRSSYGFGPFRGSSVGRFTQHSSLSAHPYVMDLREMDRQILEMAGSSAGTSALRHSGIVFTEFDRAAPAFRAATPARRYFGTSHDLSVSEIRPSQGATTPPEPSAPRRSRALNPDRAWQLGQEAEREGNMIVAKLHYQTAAHSGSVEARERLAELNGSPVAVK